jgi:hypothetical protein
VWQTPQAYGIAALASVLGASAPAKPSVLPLAGAIILPDGASGAALGRGFTGTGLARDPLDGSWWVGNDGRTSALDDPFASSLVRLAPDFSAIVAEHQTADLGLPAGSVQGVAYDTRADTVWLVLKRSPRPLVNVDRNGVLRAALPAPAGVNGLAYDSRRDLLISVDDASLEVRWRDKTTGAALPSPRIALRDRGPDQAYYDHAHDVLIVTGGANKRDGWLEAWDLSVESPALLYRHRLRGADSIEGVVRQGNVYFIVNDAYFHGGAPAMNRVLVYALP